MIPDWRSTGHTFGSAIRLNAAYGHAFDEPMAADI
jgi:hypothetical protein